MGLCSRRRHVSLGRRFAWTTKTVATRSSTSVVAARVDLPSAAWTQLFLKLAPRFQGEAGLKPALQTATMGIRCVPAAKTGRLRIFGKSVAASRAQVRMGTATDISSASSFSSGLPDSMNLLVDRKIKLRFRLGGPVDLQSDELGWSDRALRRAQSACGGGESRCSLVSPGKWAKPVRWS